MNEHVSTSVSQPVPKREKSKRSAQDYPYSDIYLCHQRDHTVCCSCIPPHSRRRPRMLPACRIASEGFAIPTFDLTPPDVEGLLEERWEFQANFHDCFPRSETRAHFFDYMVGPLSPLARKSIEPMALHVKGGTVRGLQRFLSDVPWDEEHMRWTYHQLVADAMGDPEGVLMIDETSFVKKGQESVGVARQYCGTLGIVENCQVGVFACYPP